jgi:Amt family ammonium transporter
MVASSFSLSAADTAYMIACAVGVLTLIFPGLVLYYAGMSKTTRVIKTVLLVLAIYCVVTLAWFSFGYSLACGPRTSRRGTSTPVFGDGTRLWLRGLKLTVAHEDAPTVPEAIYCLFQLAFAIVTSVLVSGSFADRVRFFPMLVFTFLWHIVVYCPIAHAIWHQDGFLYQAGVLDFAGGCVVHISAGVSSLVACAVVGNNRDHGKQRFFPHNILLTFMGVCLIFIGWMGFNGGSANNVSDGRAAMAVLNTVIATAAAAPGWAFAEAFLNKEDDIVRMDESRLLGLINGVIAGLVAITPACGFVDTNGAFWIGAIAGPLCYLSSIVKAKLGWDDALDAFGIHATGGAVGCLLTGFFATSAVGAKNGVFYANTTKGGTQLGIQIYAIVVCAGWAAFATSCILLPMDYFVGMRDFKTDKDVDPMMGVTLDKHRYGDYSASPGGSVPAPVSDPSPRSSPQPLETKASFAELEVDGALENP